MTPDYIEETWQQIEGEGRSKQGWHVRQLPHAGSHKLMIGRSMPSGSVGMVYEVNSSSIPADVEWPHGKGFVTDIETIRPGPSGRVQLTLQLSNAQYREVFSALCSDTANTVVGERNERDGVRSLIRRPHSWQKFMQVHSSTGLSPEQVRGLYAELYVLEHLLIPHISNGAALNMWQGRQGLHDFSYGSKSLEIKSSTIKTDPTISISRLDQLDETLVEALFLYFVPLEKNQETGETLPDAVSRLRSIINSHSAATQRFEDLLICYGYHEIQAERYSEFLLKPGYPLAYRVSEGFPRLRICDLSDGIVSGKYSVQLSKCSNYTLSETELLNNFLE